MVHVKVSLSLSTDDLAFLDDQTRAGVYSSRSAAVQDAVRVLREERLADAYADAFAEPADDAWDAASGDGLARP
ncbi:MAG: ribbon-helix-helix domain-containing protein [Microbacterium sp.]|uniref:ribbon-helix-helix domain-containing protein n=1 Tax=Microbacterium TaxID=33882 RepID=UPI00311FA001